jgi:hypothetical protein
MWLCLSPSEPEEKKSDVTTIEAITDKTESKTIEAEPVIYLKEASENGRQPAEADALDIIQQKEIKEANEAEQDDLNELPKKNGNGETQPAKTEDEEVNQQMKLKQANEAKQGEESHELPKQSENGETLAEENEVKQGEVSHELPEKNENDEKQLAEAAEQSDANKETYEDIQARLEKFRGKFEGENNVRDSLFELPDAGLNGSFKIKVTEEEKIMREASNTN